VASVEFMAHSSSLTCVAAQLVLTTSKDGTSQLVNTKVIVVWHVIFIVQCTHTQTLCKFELGPTIAEKCSIKSADFCKK